MIPSKVGLLAMAALLAAAAPLCAQSPAVLTQEKDRAAVVAKIKPSVVAVFARGGQGGGTGVLISDEGYALTNFHVVQPTGPTMQCGLPDGVLYDAVLVGLDKVGDVALIKLLPKQAGQKFPAATLGDSDLVHEGDWSIAMGNPFLLATDFTPTVTFGLVSGVHRYQSPAGIILEYTDCIQIDTSINPGNSGGPLFNLKGELIGINGRGSFDKRGRVNSGVGYAISINQIKNFLGHLYAGLDTDHASLGAVITTQTEKFGLGRMLVTNILPADICDAARRGLDQEDELVSFAGRHMTSVNHYKNVMGLYPRGWRVPLEYRREQVRKEILVRLMGIQRKELPPDPTQPKEKDDPKQIIAKKDGPGPQGPAAKLYQAKHGFANYYFNKVERTRLLDAFKKQGDFTALAGNWSMEGTVRLKKLRTESKIRFDLVEEKAGGSIKPVVRLKIEEFDYPLEPLKDGQEAVALRQPETSGGLLLAMWLYKDFLTQGDKAFVAQGETDPINQFHHGGYEPLYPPPVDGKTPASLGSLRVDCEVINSKRGPFSVKWFFARGDQKLVGMEVRPQENDDPCEIFFSDYRAVDGRMLPHRMQVQYGESHYGTFAFTSFKLAKS